MSKKNKIIVNVQEEIKKELEKSLSIFQKSLKYMAADAPIGVLCLPKPIEKALSAHGCDRVYDIFNVDLTKIKGLGILRRRHLAACLDQFLSVSC